MKIFGLLFGIIIVDLIFLFFIIQDLSISFYEAEILYIQDSSLHYFIKFICDTFGYNDFALRMPFVLIHILNILLIFFISKKILSRSIDAICCVVLFILLPGVTTSAILVNEATSVILWTLLFVLFFEKKAISYLVLISSIVIDNSFMILYIAIFFYAIFKKQIPLLVISAMLFMANLHIYGFDIGGIPSAHFLDTIGIYAATLSPFLFIYYVYVLYRIAIKEEKHILWFISFNAFIVTLVLSIRQKLALEDFLPFAIVLLPFMVKIFLNSYRVRLPQFRKAHKIALIAVFFVLFGNFILLIENRFFYLFMQNPQKHFAFGYNAAKELSLYLKQRDIMEVSSDDEELLLRLKFYGIKNKKDAKKLHFVNFHDKIDIFSDQKDAFLFFVYEKPIFAYILKGE